MMVSLTPSRFFSLYLTVLFSMHLPSINGASPLLVYKEASRFQPIWDTTTMIVADQCSIWRPFDQRFYPLGDILHNAKFENGFPKRTAVVVMDKGDGLVEKPQDFSLMWHEKNIEGSDGYFGVKIYKMIPSPGYTCLGHVAVNRWDSTVPNKDLYRCVRSDLVNPGQFYRQWHTRNPDHTVHKNFVTPTSFWNVEPNPMDATGIQTGLFLVGSGYDSRPTETAYVLNSTLTTSTESSSNFNDIALALYETSQVEEIVNSDTFEGPTGHAGVSFTRTKECCHLGVAISKHFHNNRLIRDTYLQPAFYVREIKTKMLAKPTGFELIWNNVNGRGSTRVSIYRPVCPRSYVALGHVVTLAFKEPSDDDIRCVHSSLVTMGKWTKIWDSQGVPGVAPVTVWRADTDSDTGVDASIFSAVSRLGEMDTNAYVLKREMVKINWGKRIVKLQISNEVYNFEKKKIISTTPIALHSRTTVNNCGNSSELKTTRTLTFTEEIESSWKFEISIEIGVEVEFKAGIPLIAESTVRTSLKVGTTYGQEHRRKDTKQDQIAVEITLPAGTKGAFYIGGDKYVAEIPWEADLLTTFADGTQIQGRTAGIYKGVQVSEIKVIKERPVPCLPEDRQGSKSAP